MVKSSKNNSGLLVCGACAVYADPDSREQSSIETLGRAISGLFAHKSSKSYVGALSRQH